MSLTKFNGETNNIRGLADKPTLSASELKEKFDKTGDDLKTYINETLTTEIDTALGTKVNSSNVYTKGDFSILSFTVSRDSQDWEDQTIEGDLPSGFTPTNCVVISIGAYLDSSCKYYYMSGGNLQYYPIAKHVLYHKSSSNKDVIELKIGYIPDILDFWRYEADTSKPLIVKVVLMKIS